MEKNVEVSLLFDFYGELLKPSCRQAVELYYNEDLSLAEISEHCGITRQGVRDAIRHGVESLNSLEESLGFYKKGERITALATDIANCNDIETAKALADSIIGEL